MRDDLKDKLLRGAINKKELETFLTHVGFMKRPGKGSQPKWLKDGFPPIIIAAHDKSLKPYMIKQVIKVFKIGRLL